MSLSLCNLGYLSACIARPSYLNVNNMSELNRSLHFALRPAYRLVPISVSISVSISSISASSPSHRLLRVSESLISVISIITHPSCISHHHIRIHYSQGSVAR